jgi:hypothetical protein
MPRQRSERSICLGATRDARAPVTSDEQEIALRSSVSDLKFNGEWSGRLSTVTTSGALLARHRHSSRYTVTASLGPRVGVVYVPCFP